MVNAHVRVTIRGKRFDDTVNWVTGAKLRPHIVVKLLEHLVDARHPMCDGREPEELKKELAARVYQEYGHEETSAVTVTHIDATNAAEAHGQAKAAVQLDVSATQDMGEAFTGSVPPDVFSQDHAATQVPDYETQSGVEYAKFAKSEHGMTVETGSAFVDQWQNGFFTMAYPFSPPSPVGGPDFKGKERIRRVASAPFLTPLRFAHGLPRRVESSIRNSWDLVPGVRRIVTKWHAIMQSSIRATQGQDRNEVLNAAPAAFVDAIRGIYKHMQSGTYTTRSGASRPVNYDAAKVRYAKGFTKDQEALLDDVAHMQRTLPGTVESRRRIGQYLFGARVEYGDPLFLTLTPTTRHNAYYLKLSRYCTTDPGAFGTCHEQDAPHVWDPANVRIPVPGYHGRRKLLARDPLAVAIGLQSMVRHIFAALLGMPMCSNCPACSCRDVAGTATHPIGGIFGIAKGICGAIEYQQNSTPHYHAANVWQQPLDVLAEALRQRIVQVEKARTLSSPRAIHWFKCAVQCLAGGFRSGYGTLVRQRSSTCIL